MAGMTGVLRQLGWLYNFAHEIFEGIEGDARGYFKRIDKLRDQVKATSAQLDGAEQTFHAKVRTEPLKQMTKMVSLFKASDYCQQKYG